MSDEIIEIFKTIGCVVVGGLLTFFSQLLLVKRQGKHDKHIASYKLAKEVYDKTIKYLTTCYKCGDVESERDTYNYEKFSKREAEQCEDLFADLALVLSDEDLKTFEK